MMEKLHVFFAGAIDRHRRGAWASLIQDEDGHDLRVVTGAVRFTTYSRLSIVGLIVALKDIKEPSLITVNSRSEYVVDCLIKGRVKAWERRRWRNSAGLAPNRSLWKLVLAYTEPHDISYVLLDREAQDPVMERCEALATAALRDAVPLVDTEYEDTPPRTALPSATPLTGSSPALAPPL